MSKTTRRITKIKKNPRNILIIGTGFGFLEELCQNFANVFIISTLAASIRRKNLIYRENFDTIEHIPDIDAIFIDRNQDIHLEALRPILLRYFPLIFVEGTELFGKTEYKYLKNFGFSVTEIFKDYHLWVHQK